jgi:hypothetical protein
MEQELIFLPFFILMLLTLVVWVYMYAKRIPFIEKSNIPLEELTPYFLFKSSPPDVANPSDNFKNLCELPVLFYALCIYCYVTGNVDFTTLVAAWMFVGFRVLHSLVHCSVNILMLRFALYCISAFSLWFMILRELWHLF